MAQTARTERLYDGDTFEQGGYTFRVTFPQDQDHGAPWEECDGHGIVSGWETRPKGAGERILCTDRSASRFYDVTATLARAKADGWGAPGGRRPGETRRAELARAVEADYEFLRGWCTDQWTYVGVVVEWTDDETIATSLWGVDTYDEGYTAVVAHELAGELLGQIEVDEPDVVRGEQ